MITNIIWESNKVTVTYDNRTDVTITSDNGLAIHLAEYILSPRNDMTYSQYMEILKSENEDTKKIEAA